MSASLIKRLLDRADQHALAENESRWEAAEEIVKELDGGKTTRQLAEEIGRNAQFYSLYARTWVEYGVKHALQEGQTFNALLRLISKTSDPAERADILAEAEKTGRSVATISDERWRERKAEKERVEEPAPETSAIGFSDSVMNHARKSMPPATPDLYQPRESGRDFDAMIETAANHINVALTAEAEGKWSPSVRSEAMLHFIVKQVSGRSLPADIDELVSEVEAFLVKESDQ